MKSKDTTNGKPSGEKNLTVLELTIMQALWQGGGCTVRTVQSRLAQDLAYTTVQTMLNILERKGKVSRNRKGRAHVYHATVRHEDVQVQQVRELVRRLFGGSYSELAALLRTMPQHENNEMLS